MKQTRMGNQILSASAIKSGDCCCPDRLWWMKVYGLRQDSTTTTTSTRTEATDGGVIFSLVGQIDIKILVR